MWTMDGRGIQEETLYESNHMKLKLIIIFGALWFLQIILEYLVWDKLVFLHSYALTQDCQIFTRGLR